MSGTLRNVSLGQTSLYQKHIDLKAKMAPFAGYDMPIQYTSVKEEVIAVRENVGVFDVSHMGEFFVEGEAAHDFVDYIITNDFMGAELHKAVYSPLCREDGTVIDDLIAYKIGREEVLICVNAANIKKDWDWIVAQSKKFKVSLTNKSEQYSLLAIQGPKSEEVLKSLEILDDNEFPYYAAKKLNVLNQDIILARTGYTGEDGFEVFCSHEFAGELWDKFLSKGVVPCGLASRDVLRLEVCYPLYGHEINDEVTPLDAGLKWTVKMDKENYIGKQALSEYKPKFRLVKLSLDKGIPRDDYPILDENENVIGKVTSGTMSVALGKGICLAHVEKEKFPESKKFLVEIRGRKYEANYHTKAFISGGHK